jgi:hypothetical protein
MTGSVESYHSVDAYCTIVRVGKRVPESIRQRAHRVVVAGFAGTNSSILRVRILHAVGASSSCRRVPSVTSYRPLQRPTSTTRALLPSPHGKFRTCKHVGHNHFHQDSMQKPKKGSNASTSSHNKVLDASPWLKTPCSLPSSLGSNK